MILFRQVIKKLKISLKRTCVIFYNSKLNSPPPNQNPFYTDLSKYIIFHTPKELFLHRKYNRIQRTSSLFFDIACDTGQKERVDKCQHVAYTFVSLCLQIRVTMEEAIKIHTWHARPFRPRYYFVSFNRNIAANGANVPYGEIVFPSWPP